MKKGWEIKKLGEICSFLNRGISPKYIEGGGICVLNQKCIRGHRVNFEPSRRHDANAKKVGSERLIQAGDVLVNSTGTGTLGRVAQLRENPSEPTTVDSHVTIVRPMPGKFYPEFFGYMLIVIEDAIKGAGEGCGGQTELARSTLAEKFLVHYPELLLEQRRIVAILDEAFEGIAKAVANTEKNLANARELFEGYLNSVFSQGGEGWVEKKLSEVCIVERGSSPRPIRSYLTEDQDGVNWVKIGDTQGVTKYIHSTKQKISKEGAEKSRRVNPGDFILTNSMSLGRPYIMATSGYIHDGWFVLRLAEEINTDFFYYLLSSRTVQEQFHTLAAGAIVKNISSDLVKKTILPIPPLAKQEGLIGLIEALSTEVQRLESIYQQKLTALAELKQSLLQKAFSGELTARDNNKAKEAAA